MLVAVDRPSFNCLSRICKLLILFLHESVAGPSSCATRSTITELPTIIAEVRACSHRLSSACEPLRQAAALANSCA